jgi:hypothetical protein
MRAPDQDDIRLLAQALADSGAEYAVIGGAAMALHGFPRMTKDIDLLLPVDKSNNSRLMKAFRSLPDLREAARAIKQKWLDDGYSTAVEGEINVDLLFVAADRTYDELRKHLIMIDYDGVPILTLDVDGMLLTKKTNRESDKADRLKLERLKSALASTRTTEGKPGAPARRRRGEE